MENNHFKTNYLSFWARFRKEFLATFLMVAAMVLYGFVAKEQYNFKPALLIVLFFGVGYGLIQLYHSWKFINEVKFIDDRMIISGYSFNKRWEKDLKIKDLKIEIKSKGRGGGNVEYFLRVISKNMYYDISRSFNWDYFSLLSIFQEFKRIKGEKIIFDEKYFLDIMEKKANGLSTLDIAFGKEIKK